MNHKNRMFALQVLACLLAAAAAAGCGGGAGAGPTAAATPATSSSPFAGTAYLKTRHTVLYAGKTYGLTRDATQAQVDLCNGHRDGHYGLPAVVPSEAVMASLDVYTEEKFFDTDKALTLRTGKGLVLTDFRRWLADYAVSVAGGAVPATPPDCSVATVEETTTGTLWRDGKRYQLHFDTRKAISAAAPASSTSLGIGEADFRALRTDVIHAQTCHIVDSTKTAATFITGEACIWDRFPFASYLNWPFALSGKLSMGAGGELVETVETLELLRDGAIPAARFAIPDGFAVSGG